MSISQEQIDNVIGFVNQHLENRLFQNVQWVEQGFDNQRGFTGFDPITGINVAANVEFNDDGEVEKYRWGISDSNQGISLNTQTNVQGTQGFVDHVQAFGAADLQMYTRTFVEDWTPLQVASYVANTLDDLPGAFGQVDQSTAVTITGIGPNWVFA